MKRSLALAIALILTAALFCSCKGQVAGEPEETLPENGTVYEYSQDDPTVKTAAVTYENGVEVSRDNYTYEENGNISTVQTVKNGETVKTTTYEYDGNTNTQIITEFEDEGIACKEVAEMSEGAVAAITYYENGEKTGRVVYTHDENGNMVKEETVDDNGNVLSHKINVYDGFGKLVRIECYEFGSLSLVYEHTYKDGIISSTKCLDSKGNLLWEK